MKNKSVSGEKNENNFFVIFPEQKVIEKSFEKSLGGNKNNSQKKKNQK